MPAGRGGAAPREAVQAVDHLGGAIWRLVEAGAPGEQAERDREDVKTHKVVQLAAQRLQAARCRTQRSCPPLLT